MEGNLSTAKTPALCFRKEDFMVNEFSVDQFVGECRKHASMETMREDLGIFHKLLCTSMVELINKDYVDFVNLSSNLVGLDRSIKSLAAPLEYLKADISSQKHSLDETMNNACEMISERSAIYETKLLTHRIVCILEGLEKIEMQEMDPNICRDDSDKMISLDILERVAMEYNVVQFHMDKMSNSTILSDKKEEVNQIAKSLQMHLRHAFLLGLSNKDAPSLRKVLQIFSAIDKEAQAEICFREEIVKPHLEKIITEEMISSRGLSKVFESTLDFIPKQCQLILDVTRGVEKNREIIRGYDFLVNAVWPVIVKNLEYIAPVYIFDHGNPDIFYRNYTACMSFLDTFEHCCVVQSSVKRLRNHPSYEIFMKKWNLDVYFEIRFQEIARVFESSLFCPFNKASKDTKTSYLLNVTSSLWFCLNRCWADGIFLQPLIPDFWRLTLQLISRFVTWTKCMLKEEENRHTEKKVKSPYKKDESELGQINRKFVNQEEIESQETYANAVQCAILLKDMEILWFEVELLYKEKISPKFHENIIDAIKDAFDESRLSFSEITKMIECHIVKMLIDLCSPHLKLITDIPRLYRKTNREVPSKPSPYVSQLLKPLENFQHETELILPKTCKVYCLKETIDAMMQRCAIITKDVLTSIKKMEDSLKILKRARDKPTYGHAAASGVMTDDDKIRRQLVIDVNHIQQQVEKLGLDCTNIKSYLNLKDLVSSAERNSTTSKS